jgi:hypothetical protein
MVTAGVLRYVAFSLMVLFTVVGSLFTAAYALDDPGGWRGALLVAGWLVPLTVLAVVAWRWPARAVPALAVATCAVVLLHGWAFIAGSEWGAVEDRIGPIRAVAAFSVAGPLAVLGLRRAAAAGWSMLALGLLPAVVSARVGPGSSPVFLVAGAVTVAGLLYLLSSRFDRPPSGSRPTPPGRDGDRARPIGSSERPVQPIKD